LNGIQSSFMPWIMAVRWKRLIVDLRPGVQGEEWDELLDAIVRELPIVSRVRLLIPQEYDSGEPRQLLDTLAIVLTKRGVDVEQRYMPR
jgi:hypothetical protein